MIEYVYFQNDVCFIADDENGDYGDCIDIDVKPGVEKVIFGDYYDFFLKLSKKVFPDVKELHISEHAGVISISNEMFPNVRKVTSEKNFYREGSMLCGGLHGDFSLYNTFCLKPDETADLSGISAILDFAFSGSETLNVTGSDGINTYNREAFNNSAIGRLPFVNGVKCIYGMAFHLRKSSRLQYTGARQYSYCIGAICFQKRLIYAAILVNQYTRQKKKWPQD